MTLTNDTRVWPPPAAPMTAITLSREELYKKVGEQPISTLARSFEISDVGLAKMCKRLDVPLPRLGAKATK
jgi:hypothetical protein